MRRNKSSKRTIKNNKRRGLAFEAYMIKVLNGSGVIAINMGYTAPIDIVVLNGHIRFIECKTTSKLKFDTGDAKIKAQFDFIRKVAEKHYVYLVVKYLKANQIVVYDMHNYAYDRYLYPDDTNAMPMEGLINALQTM